MERGGSNERVGSGTCVLACGQVPVHFRGMCGSGEGSDMVRRTRYGLDRPLSHRTISAATSGDCTMTLASTWGAAHVLTTGLVVTALEDVGTAIRDVWYDKGW